MDTHTSSIMLKVPYYQYVPVNNRFDPAASNKQQQAEADAKHKVEHARAKGVIPKHWNLEDLKAMVSWFKHPGDSKMPTTKAKLLKQYALTMNRSKEERSCLKEGEDAIVEEGNNGIAGGITMDE